MAKITFKGNPITTNSELPAVGADAPDFDLVTADLREIGLEAFASQRKLLNIFPSLDTPVCATSVRRFNQAAASLASTMVLNISCDLPFAQKRFCAAEGIDKAVSLSAFRSAFPDDYGVRMTSGPLRGLCARAVVVLDRDNRVLYTELVGEVTTEPDYDRALAALG